MSQSKIPKITVRNREGAEGKISTGANTEVLLDGKRLGSAYFVKFEVHAKKIAKVTIEMYAEIELEANLPLESKTKESPRLTNLKGKPIGIHTLSNYEPHAIVLKKRVIF